MSTILAPVVKILCDTAVGLQNIHESGFGYCHVYGYRRMLASCVNLPPLDGQH